MSDNYYDYDFLNLYNSAFRPGTVHASNTATVRYFRRYLFQKMISVLDLTIPEDWPKDYFLYVLYASGRVAVLDIPGLGVIPQHCAIMGRNVYYQPRQIIVTNPAFPGGDTQITRTIGKDCALLKLTPDCLGVTDIIDTYADMMALAVEAAGINLVNSKFAFVFGAENKRQAESYKKMADQVNAGNPAVFIDKELFDEEGNLRVTTLQQNLRDSYIAPEILDTLKQIEHQFDAEIGLPNNPIEKKERLISDEVNANNASTFSKIQLWIDTFNESAKTAERLYNIIIRAEARSMVRPDEGGDPDGDAIDQGTV